jgi:hypothetical protein
LRTLHLPGTFSIAKQDHYDFGPVLRWFDWSIRDEEVTIDFTECWSANYQALALLVLYVWRLRLQDCHLRFSHSDDPSSASAMWKRMGAMGWSQVLSTADVNFEGSEFKPLVAIRDSDDLRRALQQVDHFVEGFDLEYGKVLHPVVSELLYNTREHGVAVSGGRRIPSIVQFSAYERREELSVIVADLGIGVKRHLESRYVGLESDESALRKAIEPNVSGTFENSNPYSQPNNGGFGLYTSSDIMRQMKGDLYLSSGHGVLHVSPWDTTSKTLDASWPGTIALITLQLCRHPPEIGLAEIMEKSLEAARGAPSKGPEENVFYVGVENFFGKYAENKDAAIGYRDKYLMEAARSGKVIKLDFVRVESAPHSFLNALLKGPIRAIADDGRNPFKFIKRANEDPVIREIIDFILDTNT